MTWLFGLDLLVKLRSMLLFALYGSKFDMRDWMEGRPFDFSREGDDTGEYWFDYIADTGDGGRATYAVARMCLSDLHANGPLQVGTLLRRDRISMQAGGVPGETASTERTTLPRGRLLIIGGDAGYHVADYATLAERLQKPFWAAARQLGIDQHSPRRPLFGVPANHDYYDVLDGFARQFRHPLFPESQPARSEFPAPPLQLHGFERRQTASYFALRLPFGWSVWGVDCEVGHVDIRQQKFFRDLGKPDKLIVLTPEPSTVYGRKARDDDKTTRAFRDLDLAPVFQDRGEGGTRLDLSGDVHHYERYFGPPDDPSAPSARNYASVVCGLGGAFLHPSIVGAGEIKPQRVYPTPLEALRAVAPRLLNPLRIAAGGFVWLIGSVVALLLYAALAHFGGDSGAEGHVHGAATTTNASSALSVAVVRALESLASGSARIFSVLLAFLPLVGWIVAERKVPRSLPVGERSDEKGAGFWATPLVMAALMGAAVAPGLALFGGVGRPDPRGTTLLSAAAVFVAAGFWSGLALAVSVLRRERLFRRARDTTVSRIHYAPNVVAVAAAGIAPALVIWRFGGAHSAASFAFVALVVGAVALVAVALVAFAWLGGAAKLPAPSKAVFALFGLHHAAAQLLYPQIIVGFGNPSTLGVVALGSVVVGLLAVQLAYRGSRSGLLLLWLFESALVVGATILTAPWIAPFSSWGPAAGAVLVAVVGAAASCVSFGAYLLVALVHGGHANEAGAATGIENFKGIVRFKLTDSALTAYVIACDDPEHDPHVIDVFSLPNRAAS